MDKTFADRVHAVAAAIVSGLLHSRKPDKLTMAAIAADAVNLTVRVDAAIAAHQPAPQPEPTEDALREAYERGRANPWRHASEPRNCAAVAMYRGEDWEKRSGLYAKGSDLPLGAVWVPFPAAVPPRSPQPEPTADAIQRAYERGVNDGRANPWLPAVCDKPDLVFAFSSDRDTIMLKAPGLVRSDELWVPAPPIAVPWSSR
jgi:hypothetical protein